MTIQAPEALLTYLRQGFPVADVAPVVLPPESSFDGLLDVAHRRQALWLKVVQEEIEQGRVAWQPARSKAALYTALPKHPKTGDTVKAHPVLTGWGVAYYGDSLFEAYQKAASLEPVASSKALDRQAFQLALLKQALPTHPAVLARLSEEERTAQCLPADQIKPSINYKQLDDQGHAVRISWRSNQQIQTAPDRDLVPLLRKLKVGPRTLRGNGDQGHDHAQALLSNELVTLVLSKCGTEGLEWLQSQGFEPHDDWFMKAHSDTVATWSALKAMGLNPKAETRWGNLWHVALQRQLDPAVVDWLKAEGVSWHSANAQGQTPLHLALQQLHQPLHTLYSLQKNGQHNVSLQEHYPHFDLVKQLVVDMLKDGADLYQADGWGRTPRQWFAPFDLSIGDFLKRKQERLNPSTSYRDLLLLEPEAYAPSQRALIKELEQRSGVSFFPSAHAPRKRLTP
jgi:hypothetical protein